VQERVWREVLGSEYPVGLDPSSFVTVSELERFARELRVGPGDTFVDLGCGRGGAGLWVAAATGARLVGIDIAEAAVEAARARARAMRWAADFRCGSFERTGLDDGEADALMSVDALLFTPSKAAALVELRRVLRLGGRLVFTSWDYHRQPAGRPPQIDDHRPLLAASGFETDAYDEPEGWLDRQRRTVQGLLDACEELAAESGASVEQTRAFWDEMLATFETISRRVFVVATAV
jgi:SAM-dependent methyltransferase